MAPSIIIKTIFLKRLFSLSNEQAEYQITYRHRLQRLIGIDANQSAPDFTTIWKYENKLSRLGYIDLMFERFDRFLIEKGYVAFMHNTMKAGFIRTIGLPRTNFQIGLTDRVYNICRYVQLQGT